MPSATSRRAASVGIAYREADHQTSRSSAKRRVHLSPGGQYAGGHASRLILTFIYLISPRSARYRRPWSRPSHELNSTASSHKIAAPAAAIRAKPRAASASLKGDISPLCAGRRAHTRRPGVTEARNRAPAFSEEHRPPGGSNTCRKERPGDCLRKCFWRAGELIFNTLKHLFIIIQGCSIMQTWRRLPLERRSAVFEFPDLGIMSSSIWNSGRGDR